MDEGADMVIASRYVDGGSCPGWSLSRRLVSRGAIFLAHLLLPATRQVNDPVSGFFIFSKEVAAGAELKPLGYKILLEILTEGHFKRIAEVPYIFGTRNRGKSKLSASQQVAYLRHILSLMKRSGELLRFLKFCLVGLSGVGVNMSLLWLLTEFAGLFYILSAAIGIETSITNNFILNNYFTFADRRQSGVKIFLKRLLKFNMVSLTPIAINLVILWFLTEDLGVFYLYSNLVGVAAAALWNYLVNNWWTWKQ
jgi:dolichol-phosphate mannosyltransferase